MSSAGDGSISLAGAVRSLRQPWRVLVAIALFPFVLTSEIRQASGHWMLRWGAIATLWVVLLAIVSAGTPTLQKREEIALETSATLRPTGTPQPTTTPEPTERATDQEGDAAQSETGSVLPGLDDVEDALPGAVPDLGDGRDGAPVGASDLTIAAEASRSGYDRSLFRHWIDADGDGCDTRREVLIEEATESPTVGSGCSLSGGRWHSAYDGQTTTNPSSFDVDHFVPLAEAWDSGAHAWASSRREAFANDLGYAGSLIAVSASSNRSKSDRDPAQWKPPLESYWCTYASTWITVKKRWDLTADQSEASALSQMLDTCDGSGSTATAPPAPPSTPQPTAAPAPEPTSSSDCHQSYPDFCVPPPPPDLNCDDFRQKNFTVRHDVADPDPHRLDGDKDGLACES